MPNNNFNNTTTFVFSNEFIGFTNIPNYILNDTRISYKALGLYCQILQYQNSPNHSLYQKTLVNLKTDGKASVSAGIAELIKYGYLVKTQLKNEKGLYSGVQYTVYMKPIEIEENIENSSHLSENRKSDFRKSDFRKQDPNNKIVNKENIKKENIKSVCLSNNNINNNNIDNDRLTDEQINNNFKIELYVKDELTNFIIETVNGLFEKDIIKFKNKNVPIADVITELKKLDVTMLNKLIEYIANKFINNKDVVKNEESYIKATFINAIFEKRYKFEKPAENSNTNNGYYGTNKFCNFKQRPYDPELLRKIELKDLKGDDGNEDVRKGLYDDCSTYEEFQNRYKELHGKKNEDEEEYLIKEDDEEEFPF